MNFSIPSRRKSSLFHPEREENELFHPEQEENELFHPAQDGKFHFPPAHYQIKFSYFKVTFRRVVAELAELLAIVGTFDLHQHGRENR